MTDSVLDASQLSWSLLNDKLEFLIDFQSLYILSLDSRLFALLFLSSCFFLVMQNASRCLVVGLDLHLYLGRLQTRW